MNAAQLHFDSSDSEEDLNSKRKKKKKKRNLCLEKNLSQEQNEKAGLFHPITCSLLGILLLITPPNERP